MIQQNLADRMRPAVSAGRIGHALIFSGPAGSGKRELADWLARTLLCAHPEMAPCGECPACRKVQSGNHPDVFVIRKESKRKAILVEQVDALQEFLTNRAYEGGRRVCVIEEAHLLNEASQNKLLKTLEEPPAGVTIALLADRTSPLLPTVLSRCRMIHMERMEAPEIEERLESAGVPADRAAHAARACDGWCGEALRLIGDEEYWSLRETAAAVLEDVGTPGGTLRITKRLTPLKTRWPELLPLWQSLLRDAALWGSGNTVHPDKESLLHGLSRRFSAARLQDMWAAAHEAERRMNESANAQLVMDRLLSEWEGR